MFSRVVVVEDDFDDFVCGEDELVGVGAVDGGICGVGACGEDGVEGRDFGVDVGHVVEEGAVNGQSRALCLILNRRAASG